MGTPSWICCFCFPQMKLSGVEIDLLFARLSSMTEAAMVTGGKTGGKRWKRGKSEALIKCLLNVILMWWWLHHGLRDGVETMEPVIRRFVEVRFYMDLFGWLMFLVVSYLTFEQKNLESSVCQYLSWYISYFGKNMYGASRSLRSWQWIIRYQCLWW